MKIADAFKDRAAWKTLLDPGDSKYVTGTEADQARARAEWHANRFLAQVMNSDLEEIPRADLQPFRPGMLEDQRTGQLYHLYRGEFIDLAHPGADAYFIAAGGSPVLLKKPQGPQTREEIEARRAANEQRRAEQAKVVPPWRRR
jgi:hypothetical protein